MLQKTSHVALLVLALHRALDGEPQEHSIRRTRKLVQLERAAQEPLGLRIRGCLFFAPAISRRWHLGGDLRCSRLRTKKSGIILPTHISLESYESKTPNPTKTPFIRGAERFTSFSSIMERLGKLSLRRVTSIFSLTGIGKGGMKLRPVCE